MSFGVKNGTTPAVDLLANKVQEMSLKGMKVLRGLLEEEHYLEIVRIKARKEEMFLFRSLVGRAFVKRACWLQLHRLHHQRVVDACGFERESKKLIGYLKTTVCHRVKLPFPTRGRVILHAVNAEVVVEDIHRR